MWKYIHILVTAEQINFITNPGTLLHAFRNLMKYFPREMELLIVRWDFSNKTNIKITFLLLNACIV